MSQPRPSSAPPNSARSDASETITGDTPSFETTVAATPLAVRGALCRLRDALNAWGSTPDLAARVELVAAELCNNIAEHGFRGRAAGELRLKARFASPDLYLEISDNGTPPPRALLQGQTLPSLDVACADLPEGGFGWFLIHSETDALRFEQNQNRNHLSLRFTPRTA